MAELTTGLEMLMNRMTRRTMLGGVAAALGGVLASSMVGGVLESCSAPQPVGDGGVPGFVGTLGNIIGWARRELVAVQNGGYPPPVPQAVNIALPLVDAAQNALDAYIGGRAGGVCGALEPAVTALVDAIVGVMVALQTANVPLPPGIVIAVEAGGGAVSQLVGVVCPIRDAGTAEQAHRAHLPAAASGYTPGSQEYLVDAFAARTGSPLLAPVVWQPIPANLICPPVPR